MPGKALILVENLSVPFDRRVWQESTTLRDAGWDVHVICPQGTKRDREPYVVLDGVTIHRYPLAAATGGPKGYVKEYGAALWHTFRLALRVGKVDVVHACNPPDLLFLVARMLKLRGAKFVFDQHDLCPELYLSRFASRGKDFLYRAVCRLERATYRAADVVIATNESYRDAAVERGHKHPDDVFVVRSAPVIERFRQVDPEPELKRGKAHLLCYLGVMGPQDGVDYALRSLALLRDELGRDDWHAVFVGSGDTFDDMVELAKELGLDNVEFTGRIPDADLVRYLSSADVCLSPDPYNPLNDVSTMNKVMEYMAMSRPMVSFELREAQVSAGDAALYAPANDELEFARLTARLMDDPAERERMGKLGKERVEGPLAWENSQRALLAAYERAIAPVPNGRSAGSAAGSDAHSAGSATGSDAHSASSATVPDPRPASTAT